MSDLRRWFTGEEVLKELNITLLDLVELIKEGKLSAHHPETGEQVRLITQSTSWTEPEIINTWDPYEPRGDFGGPPIKRIPGGFAFVREEPQVSVRQIEKCFFLKDEVAKLQQGFSKTSKRTSESQTHKDMARMGAIEIWDNEPTLTKKQVAENLSKNLSLNVTIGTIGKYIKDLNPNRKPGRRYAKK